jgi:hypothetical protein
MCRVQLLLLLGDDTRALKEYLMKPHSGECLITTKLYSTTDCPEQVELLNMPLE